MNPTFNPIATLTRYVVAVLAVYVDEDVDKEELHQIVSAAERLGVPVEPALNLERPLVDALVHIDGEHGDYVPG